WCPGDPASVHYKVALEQADGRFQLEGCYGFGLNDGDGGDPFPGYQDRRAFDDTTTPSSRDYYDNSTQVAVWNISDSDSAMYANIDVTWSRPNLAIEEFFFNDSTGGDGDGRPEPDETVKLYFALSNTWADFINAWVIASTDTEGIYFSVDSVNLGDISSGDTVDNFGDPIEFTVASDFPTKRVNFTLHICGDGGSYCIDLIKERAVGPTEILLVDDAGDYQSYYTDALDSIRQIYDIWEAHSKGDPDFSFNQYEYLIWYTGDHRTSMFTQAQVESLMSFLDNGGKLFLTSQDAVEVLSGSSDPWDTLFLNNYLHVGYGGYFGEYLIAEQEGDEIGDGTYIFPLGSPGAQNQTSKDILVPDSEANPVLIHGHNWFVPATDSFAATKFQNDFFKVVVFGFGFEAINQDKDEHQGKILSKPHIVMERVLNWLRGSSDIIDWEEEFASLPKTIHLAQNYPNPFNPETKIEFRIKGGTSLVHISFKIYNIRGQLVRTLLDEERSPGVYSVTWDGKDQKGYEVSSGIYFYQLKTEDHSEVKKMILLK
ncbi:MAG: T9SS type A sorting domain-containing protein, partial [candidate division Zixibacteria bacterium]|nr:T9SS type A sorting domain-containing protein [candidate division Zixibacteria bacterium]